MWRPAPGKGKSRDGPFCVSGPALGAPLGEGRKKDHDGIAVLVDEAETCPSLGGMDEDTFVSFFCGRESQRLECVLKGSECGVSHCCATFRRSTPWRFVGGKDESAAERPLQASAISVLAVVGLKRTVQRFGISILQNSNGSFSLSGQSLCFFPRFKLKHTEINPRPARVLDTFVFAVLHPRCCTR